MRILGKKFLFVLAIVVFGALIASQASFTAEVKEKKPAECAFCGMPADESPVLIKVSLKDSKGKEKNVVFDSLGCWLQYEANLEKGTKVVSAVVLDYPTREEEKPKFTDLKKAFWVEAEKLKKTMPPYLVAFSSKDKATSFAKEKGTKVLTYAEAMDFVMEKLGLKKQSGVDHEAHHK